MHAFFQHIKTTIALPRVKYLFPLVVLTVMGCNSGEDVALEVPPPGIIPAQKFALVLADAQLAEAVITQKMSREDDPKVIGATYYNQIFNKHGISKEDFQKSHAYWANRPKDMLAIYDLVITELTKMEGNKSQEATADQ
jgi:hypothetical protein